MDTKQINDALDRIFHEEGARIVFWNDPDREFQNTLPFLMLDGVTTLRLDQAAALEAKIRLERDEPDRQVPAVRPDRGTRLRGRLAARHPALQPQLPGGPGLASCSKSWAWRISTCGTTWPTAASSSTTRSGSRSSRPLVAPDDAAADLDRKMIAVVAKADQPELFNIVRTLFHAWTEAGDEIDLDNPPAAWDQIEKFDLDAAVLADGQGDLRLRRGEPHAEELPAPAAA